jgi:hypothetical protein
LFLSEFIPLLLVLGLLGGLRLCFYFLGAHQNKTKQQLATEPKALGGPGQSTLKQIDRINGDLQEAFICLVLSLPLIFAAHLSYSYFGNVSASWIRTTVSMGGGFGLLAYYVIKIFRIRARRGCLTQRYEAGVVVARELSQLAAKGYHLYHDFPGDGFHIDHILIGPSGVMTVETKTVSKMNARGHKKSEGIVMYNGRMLHFPKYSDHECIDQAKRQAAWLSQWIFSAVGEEICARAMVAVPGWSVKRTSSDGIPVVNPKQFKTLFEHIRPRPLTDHTIKRIVQEVERQCRNAADQEGNRCFSVTP